VLVVRIWKPMLAVFLGLSLVVAGCGSGATTTPGVTGCCVATATSTVASPPAATPTPVDADTLFAKGIAGGPTWKSFHVKIALGGSVKPAFVNSMEIPDLGTLTQDVVLDGTVIEGDIDAVNLALHLPMTIPPIQGLSTKPLDIDVIIKDSMLYLKSPSGGTKYHSTKLGTFSKRLGYTQPVPTPGGSALVGMADAVESLREHLEGNGVTPTVSGIEQIGGKDAYRIDLSVPLDKLNGDLASAVAQASDAPASIKTMTVDSASASVWIYKDTYQLAQVQLAGASSSVGNLTFTMTLTNFDQPVTIDAPPASQVVAG
jgi:hypothetical protein